MADKAPITTGKGTRGSSDRVTEQIRNQDKPDRSSVADVLNQIKGKRQ